MQAKIVMQCNQPKSKTVMKPVHVINRIQCHEAEGDGDGDFLSRRPRSAHSSNSLETSLNDTGFVRNKSTPDVRASDSSRELLSPVSAMMVAGPHPSRSFSSARMARVASKPFITGIEISFLFVSVSV
jgi:hypothetical protein